MANTTIASIANTVAEGDNTVHGAVAAEASLAAGMGVYYVNPTGVKMIEGSAAMITGLAGVVKEHYATGNGALSDGQSIEIVTRGYAAIKINDPGKALGAGVEVHLSGNVAGSFGLLTDRDFVALSGYAPVGRTIRPLSNGDTVAHIKLYGG